MRLVFLGSPAEVISPLESVIALCREGRHELVSVVSQPAKPAGRSKKLTDPPLAAYAKTQGIPVLQPESARDPEFLAAFAELAPDVAITAAYGQILSQNFLAIPRRATINIHPSLLPRYRGATPVPAALLDGLTTTGVTILFTVKRLDAGNVICQRESAIATGETTGELTSRMFTLGGELLGEALERLADPSFSGEPQDEALVTECRKIDKNDGRLDWAEHDAATLVNRFRAFHPWPGSFTFVGERRVVVTAMAMPSLDAAHGTKLGPGEFHFDRATKALIVGTRAGVVAIHELKPAGGKEQDAAAFWNGLKLPPGTAGGQFA